MGRGNSACGSRLFFVSLSLPIRSHYLFHVEFALIRASRIRYVIYPLCLPFDIDTVDHFTIPTFENLCIP